MCQRWPVASYIIKKAAVYNRAEMLISLGPREQFSRKLWEHGVRKLLFLAGNGLQN